MAASGENSLAIKAGSTGQSILLPGTGDPSTFRCVRVRENPISINADSSTKLAAANSVYSSGKWFRTASYDAIRFDIPDSWLAVGSRQLSIIAVGGATTMGTVWVELTETDNQLGEIIPTNFVTEFPSDTTVKIKTTVKNAAGAVVTDATVKMTTAAGVEHTASHDGSGVYSSTFTSAEINGQPVQVMVSGESAPTFTIWTHTDRAAQLFAKCRFPSNGFMVPTSFPLPVVAQVWNQRNEPVDNATVTVAAFGDPAFVLSGQGGGIYSATIAPSSGTHTGNIVFTIVASGYPNLVVTVPASIKIG